MTEGTQPQEIKIVPPESGEISEIKEQLDRAAFEPEAAVEETGDFKEAEKVQEAFLGVVPIEESVVPAAQLNSAPSTLERTGSDQPTDPIPEGEEHETREMIDLKKNLASINIGLQEFVAESQTTSEGDPKESSEQTSGKAGFGSESSQPGDHYSGIEMIQGEVAQDSDWNEDPGLSEESDEGDRKTPTSDVSKAVQEDEKAVAAADPRISGGSERIYDYPTKDRVDTRSEVSQFPESAVLESQASRLGPGREGSDVDSEHAQAERAEVLVFDSDEGISGYVIVSSGNIAFSEIAQINEMQGDPYASQAENLGNDVFKDQQGNQQFNLPYLQLQQDMQSQNRQFTLVSNIMKVKHDTAKAAIDNVR